MDARWITLSTAFLLFLPLAAQPADAVYGTGTAALFTFTSDGRATLQEGPGWDCTDAVQLADGNWTTDCTPEDVLIGAAFRAAPPPCRDARAVAGGTPVSIGYAYAAVSCGALSAECEVDWIGYGQCVAALPGGPYPLPLKCTAVALGLSVGATLYATCANGAADEGEGDTPTRFSGPTGGAMWFDGSGEAPGVIAAPGWTCTDPAQDGQTWETRCSPTGPADRPCLLPWGLAGGTPTTSGSAHVHVSCAVTEVSCGTTWETPAGACFANPPFAVFPDAFPLVCRADVAVVASGEGEGFVLCGTAA